MPNPNLNPAASLPKIIKTADQGDRRMRDQNDKARPRPETKEVIENRGSREKRRKAEKDRWAREIYERVYRD